MLEPAAGAGRSVVRPAVAAAVGILLAAGLVGCGGDSVPESDRIGTERGRPPVVLISIDTLRSDRLPAYGYEEVDTPHLDRFRADAILYRHAYSHIPLTLPSHASMLTGALPPDHGVRDNVGYPFDPQGIPYLPRILREHGYATGAAVSSFVLRGASGISSDFDFFEDQIAQGWESDDLGRVQRSGMETLERTLPWLADAADGPFFLFFHLYEPHTPFSPPEPYRSRYESAYDGEVAAADAVVGALLEELRSLGVYEDSFILLTSDHGEGLGEHGYLEHGPFLYREALQVPLLVKLPGNRRAGETVDAPSQHIDILPTVLEVLGLDDGDTKDAPQAGTSLLRLEDGAASRDIYAETFFPRLHFGWNDLASIVRYPEQYIHGPDPELYDLSNDPGQTRNLVRERRQRTTQLRKALDAIDRELAPPGSEDEETLRQLAALGYVGAAPDILEGALPDPKSRVHVLEALAEGVRALTAGRTAEASRLIETVAREEPRLVDAWKYLGDARLAEGRPEEALTAYRQAFELGGRPPHAAIPIASTLLRLGRFEDALAHAELAGEGMPIALDVTAQAQLRLGNLEAAEELIDRLLEQRGSRVSPLITAAELRLAQGRAAEALDFADRAFAGVEDPENAEILRGVDFIRGRALAELDRLEEAESAFRGEIERFPDQLESYTHLAFLYALGNRGAEAGRTLQAMVEANPGPRSHGEAVKALRAMGDPASAEALLRQARNRWPEAENLAALAGG